MPKNSQIKVKIGADGSSLIAEFKRIEQQNNSLEASFGKVSGAATKLVGAYLSLSVIKDVGLYAVETAARFETLNSSLTAVYQSQQEASRQFERLTKLARNIPLSIDQVTEAVIKMKALGLDPSNEALVSFGNTAAAMGKDLMQFTEAVADAVVGEFERLKEFGIKAKSEGDRVKLTFQGVTTEIGKNADEIEGYLRRIGETTFAGALEEQADTVNGRITALKSSVEELSNKFASESGLTQAIKDAAEALTDFINVEILQEETVDSVNEKIDEQLKLLNTISANSGGGILATGVAPGEVEKIKKELQDLFKLRAELIIKNKENEQAAIDELYAQEQAKNERLAELEREKNQEKMETKLAEEEKERERFEKRYERLAEQHQTELEQLNDKLTQELALAEQAQMANLASEERTQQLKARIREKWAKRMVQIQDKQNNEEVKDSESKFRTLLQGIASHSEAATNILKVFAARDAIINAHKGAAQTMGAYPYPLNVAFAALHYANAFAVISDLKSESPGSNVGGAGTGVAEIPSTDTNVESLIDDQGQAEDERTKTITLVVEGIDDDAFLTKNQVRSLIDQINEERESNVRVIL